MDERVTENFSPDYRMSLRVCVLGSGSTGNCICVASPDTTILIDAGLSAADTLRRLERVGIAPDRLAALCLTHEHGDHVGGLATLYRRLRIPLYANTPTLEALRRDDRLQSAHWHVFTTGSPFTIGALRLEPFSVPHDSYDPVGFVVALGEKRIGLVTDAGTVTELMRVRLRGCSVLILEANHDPLLLRESHRPWTLKQRIGGRQGHLSNDQAAALLSDIAGPALGVVFLAHISQECNRPEPALSVMTRALAEKGFAHVAVKLTYPDRPSEWAEA